MHHEHSHEETNDYHLAAALSCALGENGYLVVDARSVFYALGKALRLMRSIVCLSWCHVLCLQVVSGTEAIGLLGHLAFVTGDGLLMTNPHELATIKEYKLDLESLVIKNDVYVSMLNT